MLSCCERPRKDALRDILPSDCSVGEICSIEQGNTIHQTTQRNESDVNFANHSLDLRLGVAVEDWIIVSVAGAPGARGIGCFEMLGIGLIVVVRYLLIAAGNGVKLLWIVVQRHCGTAET